MTTLHGMVVDEDQIARGIYDLMPENYRNALAMGMLPGPIMDGLGRQLAERYDRHTAAEYDPAFAAFSDLGDIGAGIVADLKSSRDTNRADFVKKAMRAITLAMYRVAPMAV